MLTLGELALHRLGEFTATVLQPGWHKLVRCGQTHPSEASKTP
jgi:hypothetical protein